MKKSAFLRAGAFVIGSASLGLAPLVGAPARAQPLPVERTIVKINNLPMEQVAPDVAEQLAMPAKPIVLKLNDVTLEAALRELETQSGVKLNFDFADKAVLNRKLSLDFEARFLLSAFDEIMGEAGVEGRLQRHGRDEMWDVQFGRDDEEKSSAPQSGIGPFQMKLQSVESNLRETVKLSANGQATRSQERSYSVSIDVRIDPIVNVTGAPLVILKRVEDDKGRSLLDTNGNRWLHYDFDINYFGVRPQSINKPAPGAKNLARIEGTTIYVVPTERKRWEIDDITNNQNAVHEFESGGRTISATVKSATRQEGIINVNFEMSAPPEGENQELKSPLFSFGVGRAIFLEDQNGSLFRLGNSSSTVSNNKLTLRGGFVADRNQRTRATNENGKGAPLPIAEPIKLVFDGPTEWVQTEVPFSFTDVPLP